MNLKGACGAGNTKSFSLICCCREARVVMVMVISSAQRASANPRIAKSGVFIGGQNSQWPNLAQSQARLTSDIRCRMPEDQFIRCRPQRTSRRAHACDVRRLRVALELVTRRHPAFSSNFTNRFPVVIEKEMPSSPSDYCSGHHTELLLYSSRLLAVCV